MCNGCEDVDKQASTDKSAKNQITRPNALPNLAANTWKRVEAPRPSYAIVTTGSAATVTAFPGELVGNPSTQGEAYPAHQLTETTYLVSFHVRGPWHVLSTVASTSFVMFDACDGLPALLRALKAVGITGGASGLAADVSNFDVQADVTASKNGLLTNSRTAVFRETGGGSGWNALSGDAVSLATGKAEDLIVGNYCINISHGSDNTAGGTPVMRAIESRSITNWDGVGSSLIVQGVNSFNTLLDPVGAGSFARHGGLREITGANPIAAGTLQMRHAGYWAGLRDRKFNLCSPGDNVFQSVAGAYGPTTPSILLVAPSTNEWMIGKITLSPLTAITAVTLKVRIVVDPDNRYSSGGASVIPTGGFKSTNRGGSGTLTPTQARVNDGVAAAIVATAADNDEIEYGDFVFTDNETPLTLDFESGLIVPPSGTLMILVWNGSINGTWNVELESANVQ